jgi:hypothetical protein
MLMINLLIWRITNLTASLTSIHLSVFKEKMDERLKMASPA